MIQNTGVAIEIIIRAILIALAIYLFIGLIIGLLFVISGIRRVDPVAESAPMRVRVLFLPGSIAIWPVVLHGWRTRVRGEIEQ